MLSCRAFGRKIENEMLKKTIENVDSNMIFAEFKINNKNKMVKNFYSNNGFQSYIKNKFKIKFRYKKN